MESATVPLRNLADVVRRAAARRGDDPALIFRGITLTWAEVDALVDAAAAAHLRRGLRPGDRVAMALPNGLDAPIVYFGALRAGLVAVPTNPAYTPRELAHVLGDSGAVALVGTGAVLASVATVRDRLPALVHLLRTGGPDGPGSLVPPDGVVPDGDAADGVGGDVTAPPDAEVPPTRAGEDLAVLMYTSGTSGWPRGAMLSHRALLANLEQCARIEPPVLRDDDVVLLALPLFHIYGLNPGLGQTAWQGAAAVLVERFDPVDTLELIGRHGITNVPGAPPMFVAWSLLPDFAEAFAGVRLAVSGAASLPQEAQSRLLEATGHHVFEGYGLTETAPVVTSTLLSEVAKPGSIGRPVPGVEVRLVDPTTGGDREDLPDDPDDLFDGPDAPTRDPGEIAVRGANLFSGYWPDGAGGPDASGWWRTGDVAVADADGDLFLVGRLTDLVLVSGFNVYPREVESVLDGHPDIAEAAVIGVPHPYTGETVKAYVQLVDGAHLTAEDLLAYCERSLARFKCPTAVEFVTELPHSVTGKVSKGRLRARSARLAAAAGTADGGHR